MNYSVLMSVYVKEKPEFLKESISSILNQTTPTDDLVVICDGPLTVMLDDVLKEFKMEHEAVINIVRLKQNVGLGGALNEGLKHCKNQLVARMDSDDISRPQRCEAQLKVFEDTDVDIVGSVLQEFETNVNDIVSIKTVPETNQEIIQYSKRRNPFNHPTVMFKKDKAMAVGGYEPFQYFEDYYLWVRMLQNGAAAYNIQEPLLYMRTGSGMHRRRGGYRYAKCIWNFKKELKRRNYITNKEFLVFTIPHMIVSIIPNNMRKLVYNKILRKQTNDVK